MAGQVGLVDRTKGQRDFQPLMTTEGVVAAAEVVAAWSRRYPEWQWRELH